jgi:Xaa-Pro aminopeptidase
LQRDSRYRQFLVRIEQAKLDGFLVTHPANLAYLFNFEGSAGFALCLNGETQLLVDSRYIEQAKSEAACCRPFLTPVSLQESLRQILSESGSGARIGLEAPHVSLSLFAEIETWQTNVRWVPHQDFVEEQRVIKNEQEIACLEEAFQRAQQAYDVVRQTLAPGLTENEVAGRLELEFRKAGGRGAAFETIVASGARSSLPHGRAGHTILTSEELVLIDYGIRYLGYCSDLTRIHYFPPTPRPEIHDVVSRAQQEALARIRPGVLSSDVDQAARRVIDEAGYGSYFGHSTGHGLGLEVHELPSISARKPRELQVGMTFTVEPGIYLPGRYGIRLEDAVVVTANGFRFLGDPNR